MVDSRCPKASLGHRLPKRRARLMASLLQHAAMCGVFGAYHLARARHLIPCSTCAARLSDHLACVTCLIPRGTWRAQASPKLTWESRNGTLTLNLILNSPYSCSPPPPNPSSHPPTLTPTLILTAAQTMQYLRRTFLRPPRTCRSSDSTRYLTGAGHSKVGMSEPQRHPASGTAALTVRPSPMLHAHPHHPC